MADDQKKPSWFSNVWNEKCPRCHQGDLWHKKRIYSKGFSKMHETCSHCGLVYEMEQGFWYGAMYVSYALGVALSVAVVVTLSILTNFDVWLKAKIAVATLLLAMPFLFRFSRDIWVNIFIRFDPKHKK